MSDFLNNIEMSTRSLHALEVLGVDNIDKLMAITRAEFMAQPNIGETSWRELRDLQTHLTPPSVKQVEDRAWAVFNDVVDQMNGMMQTWPNFRAVLSPDGWVLTTRLPLRGIE